MSDERRDAWRHSVDELLITLTSAQKTTDRELEDIEKELTALGRVISGDPEQDRSGLAEQIHILNREVSKLNAVIFVDSTGKKGLIKTVDDLAGGREDRRINWGNWTKIIVAAITSGYLAHLWPVIEKSLQPKTPHSQKASPRPRPSKPKSRVSAAPKPDLPSGQDLLSPDPSE